MYSYLMDVRFLYSCWSCIDSVDIVYECTLYLLLKINVLIFRLIVFSSIAITYCIVIKRLCLFLINHIVSYNYQSLFCYVIVIFYGGQFLFWWSLFPFSIGCSLSWTYCSLLLIDCSQLLIDCFLLLIGCFLFWFIDFHSYKYCSLFIVVVAHFL